MKGGTHMLTKMFLQALADLLRLMPMTDYGDPLVNQAHTFAANSHS
jgi:hypothetical protein